MSLEWVDEYHSILPKGWFPVLSMFGFSDLLTGKTEAYVEVAQCYMTYCIALGDRDGVQAANRLLELAIKGRSAEQVSAIEEARGLS